MGDRVKSLLFAVVLLAIVFSVELPLPALGSRYASINTEDFATLMLLGTYIYTGARQNDWTLRLSRSPTVVFLTAVSTWIVVTVLVATLRSSESIGGSVLWTLKWFEVVVFYTLVQEMMDERSGHAVLRTLLFAGVMLSAYAVFTSVLGIGSYRTRVFFHNPNSLAVFFNLVVLSFAARTVLGSRRRSLMNFLGMAIGGLALFSTASRSGMVGLLAGLTTLVLVFGKQVTSRQYIVGGAGLTITAVAAPAVISPRLVDRLTKWVRFENGVPVLTDHRSANAIRHRLDLLEKGFELFLQQPVFGHGWFASPSRLPPLDIHYTTLLAEVGVIGFLLFTALYASITRDWFRVATSGNAWWGYAGLTWFCSILAQSIGGNFLRTPQILFLLFLLLTAGQAVTQRRLVASEGTP